MNKKLLKYQQEHLNNFFNELNIEEKEKLLKEIDKIDFEFMNKLYKNSFYDEDIDINKITPLKCVSKIREEYYNLGRDLILNNKYAVVILAGGNGSRLGINRPKGTLEISVSGKNISLFEIYINKLKEVHNKYHVYIDIYIMTSNSNNLDTLDYFKYNNYFNYPIDKIHFFIQDDLPLMDKWGKILLKDRSHIWFAPNGNGSVYKSLKDYNFIEKMKEDKIKYVLFTAIDNPLVNLVDFNFIGATLYHKYELSSKTIYKNNKEDLAGVFCKYNNKPYVLNDKLEEVYDKYRDKNIAYHLISIDYLEKFSQIDLKYHRAYKKYNYLDNLGNLVVVDKPNAFKFEKFIYDAFYYAKDMLLYRVNSDEFYPIKNKKDIKKVEDFLNK